MDSDNAPTGDARYIYTHVKLLLLNLLCFDLFQIMCYYAPTLVLQCYVSHSITVVMNAYDTCCMRYNAVIICAKLQHYVRQA
jgi:hypothetical protein